MLFPVIHVADPAFYQNVRGRLSGADIVVMEGVSDSQVTRTCTLTSRLLPRRHSLGLIVQSDLADGLPVQAVRPDLTEPEFAAAWQTMPWWYRAILWMMLPWVAFMAVMTLLGGREWLLRQGAGAADGRPADQPGDHLAIDTAPRPKARRR